MSTRAIDGQDVRPNKTVDVMFSHKQYQYLEQCFGELVGSPKTSEAELRFNQGARSVVHFVRERSGG